MIKTILQNFCIPGSCKIKRVDKAERRGSSCTTRCEISKEVSEELSVLVNTSKEHLLVLVFESKVQSLSWEIPDNVGKITTPKTSESLFLWDTNETIDHT